MRSRGGGLQRSGEDNRELGYEIRRALWWWKGMIRMGLVNMKTGRGVGGGENSEKGHPKFVRKCHR